MKILLVYASKTGTTAVCAAKLADYINEEVSVICLDADPFPDPAAFDVILMGSPLYAGKVLKTFRNYLHKYREILLEKPVALFTCGASPPDEALACLETEVGEAFWEHADPVKHFGGEVKMEKQNILLRFMMRHLQKRQPFQSKIDDAAIISFAERINQMGAEKEGVSHET
ncbi:MAG: flavodoxin domain-containing protein [Bacillota bacterium]|nr:flavodoxin domain-containing protein [Bacillota bacterium]